MRKLLAAALANGHVLFEDYPGLGKTLLAKVFTKAIGSNTKRVQFTPDLLPADILGAKVWRQNTGFFELIQGPVFTNVLLADEINRAPPKTQASVAGSDGRTAGHHRWRYSAPAAALPGNRHAKPD